MWSPTSWRNLSLDVGLADPSSSSISLGSRRVNLGQQILRQCLHGTGNFGRLIQYVACLGNFVQLGVSKTQPIQYNRIRLGILRFEYSGTRSQPRNWAPAPF